MRFVQKVTGGKMASQEVFTPSQGAPTGAVPKPSPPTPSVGKPS